MNQNQNNRSGNDTRSATQQQGRRQEGREGANVDRKGGGSEPSDKREQKASQNDSQKQVQGKKQHGNADDVSDDNRGSDGQNIDERRTRDEHTGKQQR